MKTKILLLMMMISLTQCKKNDTNMSTNNPFFDDYTTPYEVPPFDLIKNEHYKPAFEQGIKEHQEEINQIVSNAEAPTFENTILTMENSGKLLSKVSRVFYNLNSANTNEEMQQIAQDIAPMVSEHNDNIYLNEQLFAKVKTIWDNKASANLDLESAKLLEDTYKSFVRSGANLSPEDKEVLRSINSELSVLTLKFGQNVLAETNKFELVIKNKEDLSGLSDELIENAATTAKEKGKEGQWVFTLSNASVMPFLQYADNRELRKQIWTAYVNRSNNADDLDNNQNAIKLANLRLQKAKLLGYENHAAYVLEETMAKNAETVLELLNKLWKPTLQKAKEEEAEIAAMMKQDGIAGEVMPCDWRYYSEKIRKAKFDLDEQALKPYFSLDNVTAGVFMVCDQLFGLQFKPIKNIPTYHPEANAWEVQEKDGTLLGIVYMDFHPRESKRGGAWMTSYRSQEMVNGKRKEPVISIVCNFSKPTENAPALFTFDEVSTYFHEFGHALHGLLSNVKYQSLAGTNVPRDFVELPSQVMENWAADPTVLKMYAKHYKTGEAIPDELIEKLEKAGTFGQGFETAEYLASSFLDIDFHTISQPISGNAAAFEVASMKKIGLPSSIVARHKANYFNHVFSGGYSAGYYSYIWSGVLDTDAFDQFKKTSLFNQEKALSFRKNILERGGTEDPMELYKRFRGSEPSIEPLLKKRGLL